MAGGGEFWYIKTRTTLKTLSWEERKWSV